jgi:hypothetical protein
MIIVNGPSKITRMTGYSAGQYLYFESTITRKSHLPQLQLIQQSSGQVAFDISREKVWTV